MLKVFCNGCGREITDGKSVKAVKLIEATVDGPDSEPGLDPDPTTEGHLCLQTCAPLIRGLVSEGTLTSEFGVALDEMAKTLFARDGDEAHRAEELRERARAIHQDAMAHERALVDEQPVVHDPDANGLEGGLQMSETETPGAETPGAETPVEPEPTPEGGEEGNGGEEGGEGGDDA